MNEKECARTTTQTAVRWLSTLRPRLTLFPSVVLSMNWIMYKTIIWEGNGDQRRSDL